MKTVDVYMEQEIKFLPDKKLLSGFLLVEKTKIKFCLLLSSESTEKKLILLNNSRESVLIKMENNLGYLELEKFEFNLFRVFLLQLADRFFERRIIFRGVYQNAKSEGPELVRFGGIVEINVQLCKVLNRLFSANISKVIS